MQFVKYWLVIITLVNLLACSSLKPVRFAAIGDTPYYDSDVELALLSESLEDMANHRIPFVVHVGDIFSGKTNCERELYEQRARIFSKSPMPFLITIGDNEYSDCKDSNTALMHFREIILNNPPLSQKLTGVNTSFGSLSVTRQREMIENASWEYKDIHFIMLTLPDLPGDYPLRQDELDKIINANVSFLTKNFKIARNNDRSSVVLIMHSNPRACSVNRCDIFRNIVIDEIKQFQKPVLLINGSVHSREFISGDYMNIPNLSHLRPGSNPEESWPEIIFNPDEQKYLVKWHEASDYIDTESNSSFSFQ